MKKRWIFLMAAALAMQSCHQDEFVKYSEGQNAISFGGLSVSEMTTRSDGIVDAGSDLKGKAIYILGWKGDRQIFSQTGTVNSTGTDVTYDPLQYWATEKSYIFSAIYPSDVVESKYALTKGSNPEIKFESDGSTDLLYAYTDYGTYSSENSGKVKFDFKHQLSKVAFKLTNGISGNSLDIKDFVINSVSTTGKATIANTGVPTWSSLDDAENLSVNFQSTTIDDKGDVTSDPVLIIPISGSDYSVTFKLQISGSDSEEINTEWRTLTTTMKTPTGGFVAGQSYLYTATIKGNAIEFEVSVTAWGADTKVNLDDITA